MDRTWMDRIIATTGWPQTERHSFDWAAAEAQLGTRLPADYKELAEVFGPGMFGEWLGLLLPVDYEFYALDIVASWSSSLRLDQVGHASPWAPYGLHPKPGGLLEWGFTPDSHRSFYWAVEGDDPDRWPVIVGYEDSAPLDRYEQSTTEHVHSELTRVLDEYSEYDLKGFAPLDDPAVHDRHGL